MATLKYKDPVTGEVKRVWAPSSSGTEVFLGENPTGGVANDTVATWKSLGYGIAWISEWNQLTDQTSQWGFVINYIGENDVFQIFRDQTSGVTYFRSGDNINGWFRTWEKAATQADIDEAIANLDIPEGGGGTGSNPNLLHNWYFSNPVDRKGGYVVPPGTFAVQQNVTETITITTDTYSTVKFIGGGDMPVFGYNGFEYAGEPGSYVRGYAGAGYTIDRWRNDGTGNTLTIEDDGLVVNGYFGQNLSAELSEQLEGQTVTLSLMMADGTIHTLTFVVEKGSANPHVYINDQSILYFEYKSESEFGSYKAFLHGEKIVAAKLELGSVSTLHLDGPADYAEQMAICCQYDRYTNEYIGMTFTKEYINMGSVADTSIKTWAEAQTCSTCIPVLTNVTDMPYAGGYWIADLTVIANDAWKLLTVTQAGNPDRIYVRQLINGTWSEWFNIGTADKFLPATNGMLTSELIFKDVGGGTSTGRIIQYNDSFRMRLHFDNSNYHDLVIEPNGVVGVGNRSNDVYTTQVFHTSKNKPTGTYTGDNTSSRTIQTGGIGNLCMVWKTGTVNTLLVSPNGTIVTYAEDEGIGQTIMNKESVATFKDGVLTIKSSASVINASGSTYNYQVL